MGGVSWIDRGRGVRLAVVVLVALVAGCGGDGVRLYPVTGQVTVDGAPPDGLVLLFHPQQGEGQPASASTDERGAFRAVFNGDPGMPAGRYTVTAVWPDPAKARKAGGMGQSPDAPDLLNGRYVRAAQSKLEVEIDTKATVLPPMEFSTKR